MAKKKKKPKLFYKVDEGGSLTEDEIKNYFESKGVNISVANMKTPLDKE